MAALNLPMLSQSLRNSSPKPSLIKKVKPRTVTEKQVVIVRRSGRIANNPAAVYKEIVVDRVIIPRRYSSGRRDLSNRVYASSEARADATERAEEYSPGLPSYICRKSLPKNDGPMTLIDEDGDEYPTVYLARKSGLSGGWRTFAIAHNLADSDAVYIVRVNESNESQDACDSLMSE